MLQKLHKKISEQHNASCETKISQLEIQKAERSFQKNKSPGKDGITAEFYKKFSNLFKKDLELLFEDIKQKGIMAQSMRQAVICCLY